VKEKVCGFLPSFLTSTSKCPIIKTFALKQFSVHNMYHPLILCGRASLRKGKSHVAVAGEFVHDFPGYEKCPDFIKDLQDMPKTTRKPLPQQFVPCDGVSASELLVIYIKSASIANNNDSRSVI
jgi:hypothetical protein